MDHIFLGPGGVALPRGLEELVEFAVGMGHPVMVPELPSKGLDRNADVAAMVKRFLESAADASASIIRGDAGRRVGGPALQAAILGYRLAQYAMTLEDERLRVAACQPQ